MWVFQTCTGDFHSHSTLCQGTPGVTFCEANGECSVKGKTDFFPHVQKHLFYMYMFLWIPASVCITEKGGNIKMLFHFYNQNGFYS